MGILFFKFCFVVLSSCSYASAKISSTAIWGAIYEGGVNSLSDAAALVIGQYLRNTAPVSLEADTARMCSLMDGEYGNMVPGLLFVGYAGDIVAQDQVWPFLYNVSSVLPAWHARTNMNITDVAEWLLLKMNYQTLGNWTSLITVPSSSQCTLSTSTSSWTDIPLWVDSVHVCHYTVFYSVF